MSDYRKASIANKFVKLVTDNKEYSVASLMHTILRKKNMRTGETDSYFMTDEDLLVALESTVNELKITDNEIE